MARRVRLEDAGNLYHVINRGNYRRDVFETEGAKEAFADTLDEGCRRYGWVVHAYVIMRNHFHLALETPEPNLADGMHWLGSTFATRFNRYRKERGHLFQGRYQSLLIEDAAALARVGAYIHLNPVRAHVVGPGEVASFRWSSLFRFVGTEARPPWLEARDLLRPHGAEPEGVRPNNVTFWGGWRRVPEERIYGKMGPEPKAIWPSFVVFWAVQQSVKSGEV